MRRAVVLDMDNTLYDETLYFDAVLRKFEVASEIDFSGVTRLDIAAAIRDSGDVWGDLLKRVGAYTRERQEALFELHQTIDVEVPLYDDARQAMETLRRKSVKFGILTNGAVRAQQNKVRCLGLSGVCDTILCARSLGRDFEKPNRNAFQAIVSRLDIPADAVIFVGDNPRTDFSGARELGSGTVRLMRGIYSSVPSDQNVDMEISSLLDLDKIL